MITVLVTARTSQLAQCIESLKGKYATINFIFKSSSELDITNKVQINSVFKSIQNLKYCINCAAYTAVDKAETQCELSNEVNHIGAQNLAEACNRYSVKLIHVSTDFVFDGKSSQPYFEHDQPNPINVYGDTKLKGEQAIIKITQNYFIIRTSWLYSEFGNNFLKTMIRLGSERNELSVVNDQIGTPTYARDLAEVIINLILSNHTIYGIYHYSNEGLASWYDFAQAIFSETQNSIKLTAINTKNFPTPAKRPYFSVLDKTKIKQNLNIDIPNWRISLKHAVYRLCNL